MAQNNQRRWPRYASFTPTGIVVDVQSYLASAKGRQQLADISYPIARMLVEKKK